MPDLPADSWPEYLDGRKESIFALGVITLNYGFLENIMGCVFAAATGIDPGKSEIIFQKIRNDVRGSIIRQSLPAEWPADIVGCVEHFLKGYDACALNRHDVMHSHSGGTYVPPSGEAAAILSKHTRAGRVVCCAPSVAELREIADAMNTFGLYGAHLSAAMQTAAYCLREKKPMIGLLPPLREKPPQPRILHWRPQPAHRGEQFPPPPFLV
jgi:hypothetical protein